MLTKPVKGDIISEHFLKFMWHNRAMEPLGSSIPCIVIARQGFKPHHVCRGRGIRCHREGLDVLGLPNGLRTKCRVQSIPRMSRACSECAVDGGRPCGVAGRGAFAQKCPALLPYPKRYPKRYPHDTQLIIFCPFLAQWATKLYYDVFSCTMNTMVCYDVLRCTIMYYAVL